MCTFIFAQIDGYIPTGQTVVIIVQIETKTEGFSLVHFDNRVVVDFDRRLVFRDDSEIPLTKTEFDILIYLYQNRNHVLSFTQIYEHVWGEPDYGTGQGTVGHHVRSLKRKLQVSQKGKWQIRSVGGIGYCFEIK